MKKLGSSRNQCGRCREYFNSNKAFEFHRTGQHGVDRRCKTPDEMISRGMCLNAEGYWITEKFVGDEHPRHKEDDDESSP